MRRVTQLTARLLAGLILLSASWQVLSLFRLTLHFPVSTAWLNFAGILPLYLLYLWGSVSILRGRDSGAPYLFVAMILTLVAQTIPQFPLAIVALSYSSSNTISFWFMNLSVVLILMTTHVVSGYRFQFAHIASPARGLFVIVLATLFLFGNWKLSIERSADRLAFQAGKAYSLGDKKTANSLWSRIYHDYPLTSSWGVATFNCGIAYKEERRYHKAIETFRNLLNSGAADFDLSPNLMEAYQNYHHQACLAVSGCYEDVGDYEKALHFAYMARDRYPYESWCVTCLIDSHGTLQKKISQIESQVANAR